MLGSIKDTTVREVVFGEKIKEIRQSFADGKFHEEYCKYCIDVEKDGHESERHWHNATAGEFNLPPDYLNHYEINLLDVRWNITCNMSCNYCGPFASSKWMKLMGGMEVNPPTKHIDDVLDLIQEHKQHIKQVNLIGGEPLLLRDNIRLLSILDEDTEIALISNLNADLETNKVYNLLKSFSNVNWNISFENTKEDFEYVRYGGKWELMTRNLAELHKQNNFHVGLAPVYNLYVVTKLVSYYEWVSTLPNNTNLSWSYLIEPAELAVKNQSKIVPLAIAELEQVLETFRRKNSERVWLEQMLATLKSADDVDMSDKFINKFTSDIENKYHPDQQGQFQKLWPQLYTQLTKT